MGFINISKNDTTEIHAQVRLTTEDGDEIDFQGLESIKCRLQLGAADEMTIKLPAQNIDGEWRADMPIWQVGGTIKVEMGYEGNFDTLQIFEIVSTTVMYPNNTGGEMMTIRGVSDLVRAVRNNIRRSFASSDTFQTALDFFANEYNWFFSAGIGVSTSDPLPEELRTKKQGVSDADYFKRFAAALGTGFPRVEIDESLGRVLVFPSPEVGLLVFVRGVSILTQIFGNRRLHSLSMERDGGGGTSIIISGYDKEADVFVQKEFELDDFSGDPVVVFAGPVSKQELKIPDSPPDIRNTTLAIAVVEHRGHGKKERIEVITSGKFITDITAEELAKRYFQLREQLGRWATCITDGHIGIKPYITINFDGNLAAVDKGVWLPIWVEHVINAKGWLSKSRIVRVIDEPPPLKAVE